MASKNICHHCGHNNQRGYNFCSKCGRSKTPPTPTKKFPEIYDIHPDADLTTIVCEILWHGEVSDVDWLPTVHQFRQMCQKHLTENQRQCMYRRFQLNLEGRRPVRSWGSIARERGSASSSVLTATTEALRNLWTVLRDAEREGNSSHIQYHVASDL